jgi:hypothetical protein
MAAFRGLGWQALCTLWSAPEASAFPSATTEVQLPAHGPLRRLLDETERFLQSSGKNRSAHEVAAAVNAGAVQILGSLIHRLQQHPCLELHSARQQSGCLWLQCVQALDSLVQDVAVRRTTPGLLPNCMKQLEAAGGCNQLQTAPFFSVMPRLFQHGTLLLALATGHIQMMIVISPTIKLRW